MEDRKVLLKMKDISKSFPGVKALQDVNLTVYEGEAMALLGENGAGKSTLMKILSGVYKKDKGKIKVLGQEVGKKAVKSGNMTATIAQQPSLEGETAVDTAIKIINNKIVEKNIPIDIVLFKK